MPVTSHQLLGLVELHRSVIQARKLASLTQPGALSHLFFDRQGWTADGPSRARRLLADVLLRYTEGESQAPFSGFSRADRAQVLGLYWGVTEYPASAEKSRQALIADDEVDEDGFDGLGGSSPGLHLPSLSVVRKWEEMVASDEGVLEQLDTLFLDSTAPENIALSGERRPWWGYDTLLWPESRTWPPGTTGVPVERRRIMDAARAVVGTGPSDERLLYALRELVVEDLISYYPRERCSLWFRNLNPRIIERWLSVAESSFTVLGASGPKEDGATRTRSIATATQMFFYDAVAPNDHARKRLRDRVAALEALSGVANLRSGAVIDVRSVPQFTEHLASEKRRAPGKSAFTASQVVVLAEGTPPPVHRSVDHLYLLAEIIREASRPPARQIREYLECRRSLDWDALSISDVVVLELADQSFHLDVAKTRNAALVETFAELVRDHPHTPAGYAYMVLIHRETSLIHNKNHQYAEAALDIERGFTELNELARRGLLKPKAQLEANHQLALAGAGIFVRLLEAQIRNARPGGPRKNAPRGSHQSVRIWAVRALNYVVMMREQLNNLEAEGLTAKRHADKSISSVAWRVQTELIALRAQLAVLTARESDLIPPAPHDTPRHEEASVDLATIGAEYRSLIGKQDLPASAAEEVVKLGLWLGLLNGGMLPLAADLAPSLNNISFIDQVPEGMQSERPIDMEASGRWLRVRDHDAGILSYLSEQNPAAEFINTQSRNLFFSEFSKLPGGKRSPDTRGRLTHTSYVLFTARTGPSQT